MAERKVLNKYYPPDFNYALLPKSHRPKDKQDNVRNMLPMTVRCDTCGNYMYIGTKFNMRRETVLDENYLGLRIDRFYFKCTYCYSEITFKTDPKNHDYVVEAGGCRNYDVFRDAELAEAKIKEIRKEEEQGDAMKFLENKTQDSKREMDLLDALEECQQLNKRHATIQPDEILKRLWQKDLDDEHKMQQEEQELIIMEKAKELLKVKRIAYEESNGSISKGVNIVRSNITLQNKQKPCLNDKFIKVKVIQEAKEEIKTVKLCDYSSDSD